MITFDADLTRENILYCLRFSGISIEGFTNILGVSVRKFKYVKARKSNFNINDIEKASAFFRVSFSKLTTTRITLSGDFRRSLLSHHHNNLEYTKILEDKPSIPYAIQFILITNDEFLENKMEVKAIKKLLDKKGFSYASSSLTNELKKSELIDYEPHPSKKGTFLYFKKKQTKQSANSE